MLTKSSCALTFPAEAWASRPEGKFTYQHEPYTRGRFIADGMRERLEEADDRAGYHEKTTWKGAI